MKISVNEKILNLCLEYDVNVLDIKTIKSIALNSKHYDIIFYLNTQSKEYIDFAKNQDLKH